MQSRPHSNFYFTPQGFEDVACEWHKIRGGGTRCRGISIFISKLGCGRARLARQSDLSKGEGAFGFFLSIFLSWLLASASIWLAVLAISRLLELQWGFGSDR
jgi:hypothetical protein